ncbi:MAG: LysM peptidoglycan-binding domain-containing protein [Puniceicoccaceae bacterium]|nr:LysM peptidoglycan-binding domain-containing protein [Puniceicoccaceae bacterium]
MIITLHTTFNPAVALAQSDVRIAVAGLKQDLSLLSQEVRMLRLEIEQLSRDNSALRTQLNANQADQSLQEKLTAISSGLERVRIDYQAADTKNKATIIAELNQQMAVLTKQVQAAIHSIANAQPKIALPTNFSDDYPKTGVSYTVQPGDTLSAIARIQGSSIKHIQNANKIVNPSRDLQVGQTIFIPISQQ